MSLTVMLSCRVVSVPFAATCSVSSLLPCPLDGASCEIQLTLSVAVHAHSGSAVTVTFTAPPAAGTGFGDAASESSHLSGAGPTAVVEVAPHAAPMTAATTESTAQALTRAEGDADRGRSDVRDEERPRNMFAQMMEEVRAPDLALKLICRWSGRELLQICEAV
jgi:hypothetical protein